MDDFARLSRRASWTLKEKRKIPPRAWTQIPPPLPHPTTEKLIFDILQTGVWVLASKLQHGDSRLAVFLSSFILLFSLLWKEKSHKRGMKLLGWTYFVITFLRSEILPQMQYRQHFTWRCVGEEQVRSDRQVYAVQRRDKLISLIFPPFPKVTFVIYHLVKMFVNWDVSQ